MAYVSFQTRLRDTHHIVFLVVRRTEPAGAGGGEEHCADILLTSEKQESF